MMTRSDGMTYAPQGKPEPVVAPGDFVFAAVHLDHGFNHPDTPELEDFGEASLKAEAGALGYFRVDGLTPDGLSTYRSGFNGRRS